ncbi:RIP homotypic interaction motif-containing protein [Paractinoplanes atraurantiacus]|uniref:RIP homotypic interaction motif-containing protein n=1 Tax=Paractinoplanes atraurantiacus TaxID=1036182 RepID=A0A285HCS9_9ACTN|nr:RIP homotypic interaction motif-containing protein [Actinoplanes atraurantiacus]SNY33454.1 RIP homotypic interaction motif-containing protein [Actinoplanes atraurantiacus]
MADLGVLVQDVIPFVSAAAGVYGGAVVQKVTDAAADAGADATVGVGRRLLRRLFTSGRGEQIQAAVVEVAESPEDEASVAVLRAQLVKALSQDPQLLQDLSQILGEAGVGTDRYKVTVTGSQGVQIGSGNTQTNTFTSPA